MFKHALFSYRLVSVYFLVACLAMFAAHAERASEKGIPLGWESYYDRPDVLTIPAQAHKLGSDWEALKAAHFSFIAEVLALYPADTHLYFLARDSEFLYDVARLTTQGTPDAKRVHLLNVSRGNMSDKNVVPYLAENGISEDELIRGKKAVFIDTGFAGTIPKNIAERLSPAAKAHLKTHLLVSGSIAHPSSRAFLVHLNPGVNDFHPATLHSLIVNYEHMPRYTQRSSQYNYHKGRYHPISSTLKDDNIDGEVSKEITYAHMQDLKNEWNKKQVQERYAQESQRFKRLKDIVTGQDSQAISSLRTYLVNNRDTPEGRILEAHVRDVLEAAGNLNLTLTTTLKDFGLAAIENREASVSKKFYLMEKFPEWKQYLQDPVTSIPKLFQSGNFQMIANLIDANVDAEFNKILLHHLYSGPATGPKRNLQRSFIEHASAATLENLIKDIFSKPLSASMPDLLKLIIEKADTKTLHQFIVSVLSQPHVQDKPELFKAVAEKADDFALSRLASVIVGKRMLDQQREWLSFFIERGGESTLSQLTRTGFNGDKMIEHKDLIERMIEKADQKVLERIAMDIFTKDESSKISHLIEKMLEKAGSNAQTLETFRTFITVLQNPKSQKHKLYLAASHIVDAEKRREYLASHALNLTTDKVRENTKSKVTTPAVLKALPALSPNLEIGSVVKIETRELKVLGFAGDGRRGIVYKVQSTDGNLFALKIAKNSDPETLRSIGEESKKAAQWKSLGIPHSEVLIQAPNFVLKSWVDGESGKDVIKKYSMGHQDYDHAVKRLLSLVETIRNRGAYIGDFRPPNLIWTGIDWYIIDSGGAKQGMTAEEAQEKWLSIDEKGPKFKRRWKQDVPTLSPNQCLKFYGR